MTGTDVPAGTDPAGTRLDGGARRRRGRAIAYHLTPEARWAASDRAAPYVPGSLATEGFVHLTHRMADLVEVANLFYRDEPGPHVVLTIVLDRLDAPWRYDGDPRFPHIYGPLGRVAVVEVRTMERDGTGAFAGPGAASAPRP